MNLHKVKGLEAPIVFLADPTGKWDPPVKLHVDRSGEKVVGYMAISGPAVGRQMPLLAQPVDWDKWSAVEKQFAQAEENRLMYVAATRAGAQLTIPLKKKSNHTSHWSFFSPYLQQAERLVDPGPQVAPAGEQVLVTDEDVTAAGGAIAARWQTIIQPTYATAAAKEISVTPSALYGPAAGGEHGTEWGTAIHFLLQTAMVNPQADLSDLAYTALTEQQLDPALADVAVQMVRAVTQSAIWQRAIASQTCLVEVPFTTCLPADKAPSGVPTILRGVIDLAFLESAGWTIVDYKSDARPAGALSDLVAHYSGQVRTYANTWGEIVGQKVHETGLYFTHIGQYVVL